MSLKSEAKKDEYDCREFWRTEDELIMLFRKATGSSGLVDANGCKV